jgi:hypothetical protein
VQRAFWPLSASVLEYYSETPGIETQKTSLEEPVIEITGAYCGTISGPCKSNPEDLWWAHPGLVKPMAFATVRFNWSNLSFEHPASLEDLVVLIVIPVLMTFIGIRLAMVTHGSFRILVIPWIILLAIGVKMYCRKRYENQPIQIDDYSPVQCFQVSKSVSRIYGPLNTHPDDIICRFQDSGIVAIVRKMERKCTLVGRAMIIDNLQDVAVYSKTTFAQVMYEDIQRGPVITGDLDRSISLTVTLTELRDLTSPYY